MNVPIPEILVNHTYFMRKDFADDTTIFSAHSNIISLFEFRNKSTFSQALPLFNFPNIWNKWSIGPTHAYTSRSKVNTL